MKLNIYTHKCAQEEFVPVVPEYKAIEEINRPKVIM